MLNDQIRDLYTNEKLSMREVARRLGLNMWAVRSRMRHAKIPRRSASEVDAILFARKPLSYDKKENLNLKERLLHQAALMLYWAEGAKRRPHSVDLANSDERLVLIFLRALRDIYRVTESRLRVLIYCYSNQDIKKLTSYWSKLLNIPKSQFIKPYVRSDFDPNKIGKMPNGLVHIRYSDKKLLMQIKAEIDIIQKSLLS